MDFPHGTEPVPVIDILKNLGITKFSIHIKSNNISSVTVRLFIYLIVLLIPFPALSEPRIKIEHDFYNIYPLEKRDLEREMHQRTPIIKDKIKYKGYTSWYVNWRFQWQERNGICQISMVNTDLTVKYTMPRIPKSHDVNPEVRNSFAQFYSVLFKHEENHKDSGLYAARDIEKALLSLGSFNDCQELEITANQTAKNIIKKYNKRDLEYDRKTDHGRLEGVSVENFI